MQYYRSDKELAVGGGAHVADGNLPHESLNFLPVGDTYYGYVRVKTPQIRIENIGAARADDAVSDVLVVFCAVQPDSRDFLVVGWYEGATVYRYGIQRPDHDRWVNFTSVNATLVVESERRFRIPRSTDGSQRGISGIGQANYWYELSIRAAQKEKRVRAFRERLETYIAEFGVDEGKTPKTVVVEVRQRRRSERLERRGNNRRFIDLKGYRCEACDWTINDDERKVWGSSFELHHLTPIHELPENETRVVCAEDFAVLCASCHRAIHRTEFVSDVAGFAEAYLRT